MDVYQFHEGNMRSVGSVIKVKGARVIVTVLKSQPSKEVVLEIHRYNVDDIVNVSHVILTLQEASEVANALCELIASKS